MVTEMIIMAFMDEDEGGYVGMVEVHMTLLCLSRRLVGEPRHMSFEVVVDDGNATPSDRMMRSIAAHCRFSARLISASSDVWVCSICVNRSS